VARSLFRSLPFARRRGPDGTKDPDVALRETLRAIEKSVASIQKHAATRSDRRVGLADPAFQAALSTIKDHDTTRLTRERLCTIWQAARNVASLDGAAAEIGSYRGGSAYFIAESFRQLLGREVPMEVIDTFEGHPPEKLSEQDADMHRDTSRFADTSYERVVEYLSPFELVTVHKGEFSRVAPGLPDQLYRLVHVDVDLYEPALDCLGYFAPRLVPGGVIVLDDYGSPSCPGIQRAAEEFLAATDGFQGWDYKKQLVLSKAIPQAAGAG
jgi:O-methyltransferase